MSWWKKILIVLLFVLVFLSLLIIVLAQKPKPQKITYGMSFNTVYARELGLDWKKVYDAMLQEMGIRHLRLAAHWPMVEPTAQVYNFSELDYQLEQAEVQGAEVILAVGRRLPRWPECHIPEWVNDLSPEKRQLEQLEYMTAVINRYRDNKAIKYWQIGNEPFLKAFAYEHCGPLDIAFFEKEIALVRSLDKSRPIIVTDSGNLGLWNAAFKRSDVFGTSVYVYFWNPELGQFKTLLPPFVYRVKENVLSMWHGSRPTILSELSAEPWLVEPITNVPIDVQFSRMNPQMFQSILAYGADTRYEKQYLWGVEWWYWLKEKGYPEMWDMGADLFAK